MTAPLRFGRAEVRPSERQLLVDGRPVALGARAFDLLMALVERRDRMVGKNELLDSVWPGLVVEENNLQVQISSLRKLLGPHVITTVPGRGYRFTGALETTDDGRSSAAAAAPTPAPAATDIIARAAPPTNLPRELPPLYGREADLPALRSLIDEHRLVTVVGAGGIGKSRLALAAAHSLAARWPDGAWMVELASLSDPVLLPNAVAQALDIKMAGQGAALDELVAGLAPRTALLVLDNCEHLLDAVAALAQVVLQRAPNVTMLTTSQEPLRLPAEQQYRLMPLSVPPGAAASSAREFGAVALFEARVQAADPRFSLNDENLALVIDICRRLDGLPLAIELAAARVATLGLRPVSEKLDARFKLLTGGSRATLRRHQTLRAALEWSHNLLNEGEKAVFRRLGVFAGGFTVELAQAVAGDGQLDEWAVLDHLSALVDKSLVVADAGDSPRYRLLESARAFALEQLAAGETADTLRRHALAMRNFLERADGANLDGELRSDQYAALVLPELDNLRAAHAWATGEAGDPQLGIGLAAYAGALIDYAVECADWLAPLRRPIEEGTVDPAVAARYWRAITATNMTVRVPAAVQAEASTRARSLYQALGQPRRVFSSLIQLARHRMAQHNDAAAQAAADEARALIQPDWPAELLILLLRIDGYLARRTGRFAEALALFRDAVRVSVSTQDWRLEVMARSNVADLLWQIGPIEEAAREACKLADELRARPAAYREMAMLFANAMGILSELGRIDEASAAARDALPLIRRAGEYYVEEWAYLFWRRGQIEAATRLLGASDAQRVRAEVPLQENERRLTAELRAAQKAQRPPEALARDLAAGGALGEAQLLALIAEALNPGLPNALHDH
jgi:predicted ATPase/DNA-binding winged helix-turn-helix (wHTH) protein